MEMNNDIFTPDLPIPEPVELSLIHISFFSQKSVHPKCTAAAGSHCYKQSSPGLRRLTKGHFPQRKGRCIIDELNFLLQQAADFGECSAQIAAVQCIVFVQPL